MMWMRNISVSLGICGWGGMALNAAAIDTRIKATVTSTMYDMSRVNANGYFDAMDTDARYELRKQLNEQRTADAKYGSYALAGGLPDTLPDDAPQFLKDYYAYYKDEAWLPQAFAQLEWRMEQDLGFIFHQYAYTLV